MRETFASLACDKTGIEALDRNLEGRSKDNIKIDSK
jgi:hypothetical protein